MKIYTVILLSMIIILSGCSNLSNKKIENSKKNIQWIEMKGGETYLDLQSGDIIIKERQNNTLGLFGHSAIMFDERIVYDYPKLGEKSYAVDIDYWLEKDRKILILRYKNMTDEFRTKLLENMKKYFGKKYEISSNKNNTDGFYCSQYIWYVYYITAKELGYELDLDSDGGKYIFPYDFINSSFLNIIY